MMKYTTIPCCLLLLVWLISPAYSQQVLVEAESFDQQGGWKLDTQFIDTMGSPYLLAHGLTVAMASLPFSLVDIEPFDAWVFRVAGRAAISIAIAGLGASLFVPMAYCRFGCPTGAMLNFLRFNSRSDRWAQRDWCAVALLAFALGIWIAS